MFTGIVQAVGRVRVVEDRGVDRRLVVETRGLDLDGARVGDSIAVNGCCLTAVLLAAGEFTADVSRETLERTTLGSLAAGSMVNLEPALALGAPLGGHLVSGHVDGIAEMLERRPEGRSERWRFRVPPGLARYIAEKGSVCLDGVSLTVNEVSGREFGVNLVPHTLSVTTLGQGRPGSPVNLEVDLLARYVERLLQVDAAGQPAGLSAETLARAGFPGQGSAGQ